jgi:peptidoglycan hydrolase-like protein with peptidoglycan-binding domain
MSKENVKQVQAALKSKGMDPGPEDGVMGPKTQAALREFQKSNNLQVTGRLDDKTASALGVESGSGMGSSSGRSTSPSSSSGRESSSGTGASSPGSSPTDAKSGASQSPSGTQGGTSASPPSKPTGKE